MTRRGGRGRTWTVAALLPLLLASLLTACGGEARQAVLNWYINPDNGGQAHLAAKCSAASQGRYRIVVSTLPRDATAQREQLVRRLAAKDASIALMSLDPPFVAEFAEAGFLRPFSGAEAGPLTDGVLAGPVDSATWGGRLVAAPFWANSQLLWYRKSAAARAGLDPTVVTWPQVIQAATQADATVEVQGARYEGYMVLISALVASAGGAILKDPEKGKDVTPGIDSEAGRRAAAIIAELAHSPAADPSLSTTDEEAGRAAFQGDRGGFMANWAYIYGAAQEAVAAGALPQAVLDDIGWARYPRADDDRESRPPLGGIDLAIGAYTPHENEALEAVRCLTTAESQRQYMLESKNPAARAVVYDDAEVRRVFPMADLIRESIGAGAPRPKTPYYTDVSAAVVRTFHPPNSVQPEKTPRDAARLIVDVLHDRVLL